MAYLECENLVVETWYDGNIILEINKYNIATLYLNRKEKHNALNEQMVAGLSAAFQYLTEYQQNNTAVRILILRATGRTFCAGADLKLMQEMVRCDYQANYQDAQNLADVLEQLNNFSCPTISVIQGNAYGGGVGLICCTDFALATNEAKFCLSEVKLGIIPAVISPYVYETIGHKQALRLFISAKEIASQDALSMGMLSHVLDSQHNLNAKLEDLIGSLLNNGPIAMQEAKRLVKQFSSHNNTGDLADTIAKIRISAEGQEGLLAFLEKRKPNWIND